MESGSQTQREILVKTKTCWDRAEEGMAGVEVYPTFQYSILYSTLRSMPKATEPDWIWKLTYGILIKSDGCTQTAY